MNRIYIYLLTRKEATRPWSDECAAVIVRARSSNAARRIAADSAAEEGPVVWREKALSTCRRLGEVTSGAKRTEGVLMQDVWSGG